MTKYLKYLFYPTVFLILNLIVILTVIFNNPSYIDIYIKDYSKTLFKKNYSIDFSYDKIIGTLTNGYYIKNINFSSKKNNLIQIDSLFFNINIFNDFFLKGVYLKNLTLNTNIINLYNSIPEQNNIAINNKKIIDKALIDSKIENITFTHKDYNTNLIGLFEVSSNKSIEIYSSKFNMYNSSVFEVLNISNSKYQNNDFLFTDTKISTNNSLDNISLESNFSESIKKNKNIILNITKKDQIFMFESNINYNLVNYASEGLFDLETLSFESKNNLINNDIIEKFDITANYIYDNNYSNDRFKFKVISPHNNISIVKGAIDLFRSTENNHKIDLSIDMIINDEIVKYIANMKNLRFGSIKLNSKNNIDLITKNINSSNDLFLEKLIFKNNVISNLNSKISLNVSKDNIEAHLTALSSEIQINKKKFDYGFIESSLLERDLILSKLFLKNDFGDNLFLSTHYKHNEFISLDTIDFKFKDSQIFSENIYIYKNDKMLTSNEFIVNIGEQGESKGQFSFNNLNTFNLDLTFNKINLLDINKIISSNIEYSGIASGRLQLKSRNNSPVAMIDLNVNNGNYDKIIFDKISMLGSFANNKVIINNFNYSNYKDKFVANGWFSGQTDKDGIFKFNKNDTLDFDIDLSNFMFSKVNRYLPFPEIVNGYGSGSIKAKGNILNPFININLDVESPVYDKLYGENLKLRAIYKNHLFYIKQLTLNTALGKYTASGFMPLLENSISNSFDVILTGKSKGMELLEPYMTVIDSVRGDITFKLDLTGNKNNFNKNGMINIINANLYYEDLNNYTESINGTADIINNNLIIKKLNGTMDNKISNDFSDFTSKIKSFFRKNNTVASSNINCNGSINIKDFLEPDFALNVTGNKIFLDDSDGRFYGNGDLDIFITGSDTIDIKGNFIPSGYDFKILEIYDNRISIDETLEEYSDDVTNIDIQFIINDPIKVETDNFNLAIDGDVNMISKNNSDISFAGKLSIIDGKFYDNQGNVFTNTNGEVILNPIDFNPFIDIHAQTSISDELIELSFVGFSDNPNLILETTSDKYTQSDILELLTFRSTENSTDDDRITKFFANYIEKEIERNITKYSVLDEFEFRSDQSIVSSDEETDLNLFLGKQLSNKLYLNTEFPIDDMNKMQYQVIYRINKNMSVVARVDDEKYWHLNYKIKYYY